MLVFDDSLEPGAAAALGLSGSVALFPMTGNWLRIRAVADRLAQ